VGQPADRVLGRRSRVNREDCGLLWNSPLEKGGFLMAKSVWLEIEVQLIKK
jgi:hypothetical protein